jgi:Zn-dependent protease/CBS domain-containing protein
MKGEFQVGRLFGIPIKIHWTLILFLPVLAYLLALQLENVATLPLVEMDPEPLLTEFGRIYAGVVVAVGLFVSVLLHELGHALTARREGVGVEQITLWIFGGLAMLEGIRNDPKSEAKIAVAGPLVSLALGAMPAAFLLVDPHPYVEFPVLYLAYLNVVLAVFNMLPAFPLDGGRLFRALMAMRMPFGKATDLAANVGKGTAVLMGLGGLVWGNLWLVFIALFVYMGASQEAQGAELFDALAQVRVREIMDDEIPGVQPDAFLEELVPMMLRTGSTGFPVLEDDTVVGVVTLGDVQDVPEAEHSLVRVADVMTRDLLTIGPEQPASEALRVMRDEDVGRLLVTSGERLDGVITRQGLRQAFQVLEAMPRRPAGPVEAGSGEAEGSSAPRW